jgi:serine protease DegQ
LFAQEPQTHRALAVDTRETRMTAASQTSGVLQSLSNDLAGAVERAGQSIVAIHARRRIPASGIHWRPGVVVTANHTLHRDDDITVTLPDGSTVPAVIAGRDPSTDLAILKIDAPKVAVAESADGAGLRVGRLVLAVGRPGTSVTASMGVISAVGGEWRTWHGGRVDQLVRLDIAIYDGFSGGALLDSLGAVLGINTSGLSRASALTVPAATVNRVIDVLLKEGRVARGYVGLGMQPVRLPDALASQHGVADGVGLMVVSAEASGPADKAGVMIGDVLIALDDTPVTDPSELLALLSGDRIGSEAKAKLIRAGKLMTLGITVGERPSERGRRR